MKAVLVLIEGTIGDTRSRQSLAGTPDFYKREELLKDVAVPEGVRCLRELAQKYKIVYLAARPPAALGVTEEWLRARGCPEGPVYLAPTQPERIALAQDLKTQFDFIAGIGTAWSDNELHLELGCISILLKENEGNWDIVRKQLLGKEHTALQTAASLLAPWAKITTLLEPHRMDVTLAVAHVMPAVQALRRAHWGYLSAITGLDHPSLPADLTQQPGWQQCAADLGLEQAIGSIEVLYHFCSGAAVVTLRTHTPREAARVPSICSVIPAASFFERELAEMLGVVIADAPDSNRLFLPDDWPDGVYPLRKDFAVAEAQARK
jgi:NADH:ubiquinone oxidoreductase subunit C